MRSTVKKKDLENAVSITVKAISQKSPLPILYHFLIKAKTGSLQISATDLELGIECTIDANVIEEGAFTTPASTLHQIISLLPEGDLTIIQEHESLEIHSEHSRHSLMTLPPDEFPLIPRFEHSPGFVIKQRVLKEMIRNVIFAAASQEETRAVLTGVLINIRGNTVEFITTDGRRLARMTETISTQTGKNEQFVIPSRTLSELSKFLRDPESDVTVMLKGGQVLFDLNDIFVTSRVLGGNFPKFDKVIPETSDIMVLFDRQTLLMAMKRTLVMAQEKQNPKLIKLLAEKDKIVLRAHTPDLGSAYEEIPVSCEGHGTVEVAFNGQYFVDVLNILPDEQILLGLSSSETPGVIRAKDKSNYVYVIMPVKLREIVISA